MIFLTMGSSDDEGLSQLYLELVDAYKKRFMPLNGLVPVLKSFPTRNKMRKSFKTYVFSKIATSSCKQGKAVSLQCESL